MKFTHGKMKRAAADIVERARAGDQVAMGLIVMVREQSQRGNAQARQSFKFLQEYISAHPPSPAPGAESAGTFLSGATNPAKKVWIQIVQLANGPTLLSPPDQEAGRLKELDDAIEDPELKKSYRWGVGHWRDPKPAEADKTAWGWGRLVGIARAIQAIRIPSTPLSVLCPVVAWELEEAA